MNHPPHVMLVGLGAIGVIYADRLQRTSPDSFRVLVDAARKERYEADGIHLNDTPCSFTYVTPDDDVPPADLILVAVKQHHLAEAIEEMRPFVSEETIILSLLNGISSEEILAEAFPEAGILHGFVVGTDATRIGSRTTCGTVGRIVFGEKDQPVPSEAVVAVSQLFEEADIPCVVPEDIRREQWWKFMMNVGVNQVSAVTGATYGEFARSAPLRALMAMACREVLLIAPREGVSLDETAIEGYFDIIGNLAPEGKTSMLQDMEAGRPTEVELFSGTVIALGKRHGIPTPVNEALYLLIRHRTDMLIS